MHNQYNTTCFCLKFSYSQTKFLVVWLVPILVFKSIQVKTKKNFVGSINLAKMYIVLTVKHISEVILVHSTLYVLLEFVLELSALYLFLHS